MNNYINTKPDKGFTIIELLIVIVIIAILVAIVAVSYNGITKGAKESTLKSDLKQASTQLELDKAKNGSYPTNTTGLKSSSNNTPIQDITKSQCNALPVYDGTNSSAIRTVTDNRDGTTRNYEIAKLADNNCWMLTNLKLGKTTGTTTLTPANTNITSNFILPQVGGNNTLDNDNPRVYGPVSGDTGSGATNYGYLYNWSAATAGESRTSHPANAGNAPHSICPKNWRLPVGGDYDSGVGEFADLDKAFGGTGKYQDSGPSIAKWNYTGPFKGVLSGYWYGGFLGQSSWGSLWSSSAYPDGSDGAFNASFGPSDVYPGNDGNRDDGLAVRCLLN